MLDRFRRFEPIKRTPDIDESLREKTLDGRKTCFIRVLPYLQADDTFEIFGATFVVIKLEFGGLEDVCRRFYREAGYDSYEALRDIWTASHGQFRQEQRVATHWFKRM